MGMRVEHPQMKLTQNCMTILVFWTSSAGLWTCDGQNQGPWAPSVGGCSHAPHVAAVSALRSSGPVPKKWTFWATPRESSNKETAQNPQNPQSKVHHWSFTEIFAGQCWAYQEKCGRPPTRPEQFLGVEIDHRLTANQRGLISWTEQHHVSWWHRGTCTLATQYTTNVKEFIHYLSKCAWAAYCSVLKLSLLQTIDEAFCTQRHPNSILKLRKPKPELHHELNWNLIELEAEARGHCALCQTKTKQLHQSGTNPPTSCELEHKLPAPLWLFSGLIVRNPSS